MVLIVCSVLIALMALVSTVLSSENRKLTSKIEAMKSESLQQGLYASTQQHLPQKELDRSQQREKLNKIEQILDFVPDSVTLKSAKFGMYQIVLSGISNNRRVLEHEFVIPLREQYPKVRLFYAQDREFRVIISTPKSTQ